MKSLIEEVLSLRHPAVGLARTPGKEPGAMEFRPRRSLRGGWGCSLFLFSRAFDGRTVAFRGETSHCPGSFSGLALAPAGTDQPGDWARYPGGTTAMLRFLSCGNRGWPEGRAAVDELRAAGAAEDVVDDYLDGERYKKSPELALEGFGSRPRVARHDGYLTAKPLGLWDEPPEVVVMLADAQQLSALTVLANYARPSSDNVIMPMASGCASIWAHPVSEMGSPRPRAVVGLIDISARLSMRGRLKRELLSFAMPRPLFEEMESNVESSFLRRPSWTRLDRGPEGPGRPRGA